MANRGLGARAPNVYADLWSGFFTQFAANRYSIDQLVSSVVKNTAHRAVHLLAVSKKSRNTPASFEGSSLKRLGRLILM